MSSDNRLIASRYVEALFTLAAEEGKHDAVKADLLALKAALHKSMELAGLLTNPVIGRAESGKALAQVLSSLNASDLTQKFFALLARNGRLVLAPLIIETYLKRLAESCGELEVQVTAAQRLSPEEKRALSGGIAKATGKKVSLQAGEDPGLIGGLRMKIGSLMLDNSIKGKLQRLKQSLTRAA